MSAIERLVTNYARQVALRWPDNLSGKQRVWLAVYPPAEERRLRARLPQFEAATFEAKHTWDLIDLSPLLARFIAAHEYREGIFAEPNQFHADSDIEEQAAEALRQACSRDDVTPSSVLAVIGLASLFDHLHVSSLLDRVEDSIRGRLLVFFPGEYQHNVYRFMDARDGFNYMALPITSAETFLHT